MGKQCAWIWEMHNVPCRYRFVVSTKPSPLSAQTRPRPRSRLKLPLVFYRRSPPGVSPKRASAPSRIRTRAVRLRLVKEKVSFPVTCVSKRGGEIRAKQSGVLGPNSAFVPCVVNFLLTTAVDVVSQRGAVNRGRWIWETRNTYVPRTTDTGLASFRNPRGGCALKPRASPCPAGRPWFARHPKPRTTAWTWKSRRLSAANLRL